MKFVNKFWQILFQEYICKSKIICSVQCPPLLCLLLTYLNVYDCTYTAMYVRGSWHYHEGLVQESVQSRILGRNPDKGPKSLKSFLLTIHSYLYSYALRFLFLQTHAASYSFQSKGYTVKEKRGKPERKPYPPPPYLCLRNPYRNLKSTLKIMSRNLNETVRS